MQLHELKTHHKLRSKKRIGRSGKRGSYSGRGIKGQKSRSGHRIRPAERDLIQRLPKLRGSAFNSLKKSAVVINIGDLEKRMKSKEITLESLVQVGLLKKSEKNVKILGKGDLKRAFEIKGIAVSLSAKKKIESAGGKVIPDQRYLHLLG